MRAPGSGAWEEKNPPLMKHVANVAAGWEYPRCKCLHDGRSADLPARLEYSHPGNLSNLNRCNRVVRRPTHVLLGDHLTDLNVTGQGSKEQGSSCSLGTM